MAQQLSSLGKQIYMKGKGKYFVAAGVAVIGCAVYYFLRNKKTTPPAQPQKENERHHLTNAFSKAKQVATGR